MDTSADFNRALGSVVRHALSAAGVSHRTACAETGIALTTLHRRLIGASPFTVDELRSLASVAGTSDTSLIAAAEGGVAA